MEEESPENLVNFVKSVTSSVQSVLQQCSDVCKETTHKQNYTRRRRLNKKSQNTQKSFKKKEHLAQQFLIQHMYSTSMLNATPVCFGDKLNAVLGIEPQPEEGFDVFVDPDIQFSDQFLTDYIPSLGSPRENRPLSYDIYSAGNNLQYQRPSCMYDVQQMCGMEDTFSPERTFSDQFPTEDARSNIINQSFDYANENTAQYNCANDWSSLPEWGCRSERLSPILDDDDSLDSDTLDDIFAEMEQNSVESFTDGSQSSIELEFVYSADGESSSETKVSSNDSLSCSYYDSDGSVSITGDSILQTLSPIPFSPPPTKTTDVLPSFSSIFL